ncbi:MAG TPA: c-type cytochrome [Woeseiaceae bacterium]|nr:c-type cytochrome [Woeseiaceae bacterium]
MKLIKPKPVATALAAFALLACSSWAAAQTQTQREARGDPDRGREQGLTCLGCHGIEGYRNAYPSYRVPKLGGQKAAYVQAALQAYRDGTRPHPTMQAQGSSLSDEDIADIAAWLEQAGTAADEVDAQTAGLPEAAVACVACHGTAGANITPAPPVLSGQYQDYLVHALGQYREQARGMSVMNSFAAGLTEEQVEQVTAFYSSREGLDTLDQEQ